MFKQVSNFTSLFNKLHLVIELFACHIFATFLVCINGVNQLRHSAHFTKGRQTQVEFIFKK